YPQSGAPGVRKDGWDEVPAGSVRAKSAGPFPLWAFGSNNGFACNAMNASQTLLQTERTRAFVAAAGAAGRLLFVRATSKYSGVLARTAHVFRADPRLRPSARAGETRQNAQQNAHRCHPPGGDAGSRCSR